MDSNEDMNNNTNEVPRATRKRVKKTVVSVIDTPEKVEEADKRIESIIADKKKNLMAARYKLAYAKLYGELPKWKAHSFIKGNCANDDGLYCEFIGFVIALAEDETQELLPAAK